jgi:hypothetical protein
MNRLPESLAVKQLVLPNVSVLNPKEEVFSCNID